MDSELDKQLRALVSQYGGVAVRETLGRLWNGYAGEMWGEFSADWFALDCGNDQQKFLEDREGLHAFSTEDIPAWKSGDWYIAKTKDSARFAKGKDQSHAWIMAEYHYTNYLNWCLDVPPSERNIEAYIATRDRRRERV